MSANRQLITFSMDTDAEFQGGWWTTDFAAPPGQDLAAGTTYQAQRYPFNDGSAGFDHGGNGRGCNTLTATFTIHELAYDPDGTLRTFRATFEQHCEGGPARPARHLGLPRRLRDSSRLSGRRGSVPGIVVGTWNLENLFRPGSEFGPRDEATYERKLAGLAAVIDAAAPDVLAVQEVGEPEALADLVGTAGRRLGGRDRRRSSSRATRSASACSRGRR